MNLVRIFFTGILFLSLSISNAQENEAVDNLHDEFDQLIENSETYQQYKVIPITKLRSFSGALKDTLALYNKKITSAKQSEQQALEAKKEAEGKVSGLQDELQESQKMVDSIMFLGIPMTKVAYNLTVWIIIGALVVALIFLYLAFLNSHKVTKQAKKDKERIDEELESLRKRSHEKQVKIKRELQTALNKLDELNR